MRLLVLTLIVPIWQTESETFTFSCSKNDYGLKSYYCAVANTTYTYQVRLYVTNGKVQTFYTCNIWFPRQRSAGAAMMRAHIVECAHA